MGELDSVAIVARASASCPLQAPAWRMPSAFWDITNVSVLARLQRNDDDIARNGVLGRYDFVCPSLAMTKRRGKPRSATGLRLSNVMIFCVLAWLGRNEHESNEVR